MPERVIVAMSGGVDSSVAAHRLVRAGYEVVGVTLHLWDYPDDGSVKGRCCAPEDIHDARAVADQLGIAHYAFDRRETFLAEVVSPFVDEYLAGRTPSPCVWCNRQVKTRELLRAAEVIGATRVATGHYARWAPTPAGPRLQRGVDLKKDQSYFLHMLGPRELERFLFPLGEATKEEVRAEALALGLVGASKGESQELCFIADGHYADFVAERAPERVRPGPILDERGRVVGQHDGAHAFTVGQRRSLGVAVGKRAYVVHVDGSTGAVQLGDREQLEARSLEVDELSLAEGMALPLQAQVAVRYGGRLHAGQVRASDGGAVVEFVDPVQVSAVGQYAVFYDGDWVLGGGRIRSVTRRHSEASTGASSTVSS